MKRRQILLRSAVFTIITICFSVQAISQSKAETQDWIKKHIEMTRYENVIADNHVTSVYQVNFTETEMILTEQMSIGSIQRSDKYTFTIYIPLKEIYPIKFETNNGSDGEGSVHLWIITKGRKKVIHYIGDPNLTSRDDYIDSTSINFHTHYMNKDMELRMIKAFNHLIFLYGGSLPKEIF
jgi:hypothetical protein